MSAPVRIQLRRTKGWRMPANTVKVDRSTPFGNPFDWREIKAAWGGTREEAVAEAVDLFGCAVTGQLENIEFEDPEAAPAFWRAFRERVPTLRGKNLACWCAPGSPCHADVLLELANA